MTPDEARRLALALPESAEQDHHGFPSFRIRGRIFATLPDDTHVRPGHRGPTTLGAERATNPFLRELAAR